MTARQAAVYIATARLPRPTSVLHPVVPALAATRFAEADATSLITLCGMRHPPATHAAPSTVPGRRFAWRLRQEVRMWSAVVVALGNHARREGRQVGDLRKSDNTAPLATIWASTTSHDSALPPNVMVQILRLYTDIKTVSRLFCPSSTAAWASTATTLQIASRHGQCGRGLLLYQEVPPTTYRSAYRDGDDDHTLKPSQPAVRPLHQPLQGL